MEIKKMFLLLTVGIALSGMLSSCATSEGLGKDIENLGQEVQEI